MPRKSTRLEAKPAKVWKKNGAWGTRETPTNVEGAQSILAYEAHVKITPIEVPKPHCSGQVFSHKEYDTTDKTLPNSQPLIPWEETDENSPTTEVENQTTSTEQPGGAPLQVQEESAAQETDPVTFSNPEVVLENPSSVVEITFINKKIEANIPDYANVDLVPNKPYNGIDGLTFAGLITNIYEDTLKWRKNLFQVPSGKCGKDFIKLLIEWFDNFVVGNTFQGLSLKVIMIIPNLLLQKPSATSKSKEHSKALEGRLKKWSEGKIQELWKDCHVVQNKLTTRPKKSEQSIARTFTNLMFEGKARAAIKYLEDNAENAVLKPTPEVVEKLQSLHPESSDILPETLYQGPLNQISSAHFDSITEETVRKAASQTQGSGGPSLFDSKQWRRILCSNSFKTEAKELRERIAAFAKKIATEFVDPNTLEAYLTGRLLALDKSPGDAELQIRPIAVGEVLRRIVGKTIAWCLNTEIQKAAGPLQVSTGLKGGAEAAIHSMKKIFDLEGTDAVILVDAANAFNRLNRAVALHNIQYICPPFSTILINTYRNPARLIILGGGEILSNEGTTQGDTLAMAFYGLCTNPILQSSKQTVPSVHQVWLADDATGAGSLPDLRKWWDAVKSDGLKYGYYVKPSKSWVVLKNPEKLEECREIFESSPINITTEGKRHLGASIGSQQFKNSYIDEKIAKWTQNIEKLAEIAQSQPHAAYAAYIHAEQHKYTYFLRTIPGIEDNLKPLDDALNNTFIPALFGNVVDENTRDIISLPIREGGLGIRKVGSNSDTAYETSVLLTSPLTEQIFTQSDSLPDEDEVKSAKTRATQFLLDTGKERAIAIVEAQDETKKRSLEQLSQPGASSWLGALPLKSQGFNLNKGEFQDALALRYHQTPKNLPSKCPCGQAFNTTHALDCHLGGFINARHDIIRDFELDLLKSVVHDVEKEPGLQPVVDKRGYKKTAILKDDARLDIRARGFWRHGQNAFFDVRVTNADAVSQQNSSLKAVLQKHESEKKRGYNKRVMEVEHGSFTPLIFTSTGVMSHECSIFHKALAEKISSKQGERYDEILRYMRVRLSFLALKSTLLCLRGSRSSSRSAINVNLDFGLALNDLGL